MEESKNLFVGLLVLSLVIIATLVVALWLVDLSTTGIFVKLIFILLRVVLSVSTLFLFFGIISLFLTMNFKKSILFLNLPKKFIISHYAPIIVQFSKIFGFDKERVMSSFIQVGKQLVDVEKLQVKAEEILIMTPHCIQISDCIYRVTSDFNNCRRCGRCQVGDLIGLKEKYGVNLAIATGGTLARKIIKETRPKAIIAIACERDLSSGIQDIYPLPVIGILNLRPNGPCFNTSVEIEKVEEAIKKLIGK